MTVPKHDLSASASLLPWLSMGFDLEGIFNAQE